MLTIAAINDHVRTRFFVAFWIGEENVNAVKKTACEQIDRE